MEAIKREEKIDRFIERIELDEKLEIIYDFLLDKGYCGGGAYMQNYRTYFNLFGAESGEEDKIHNYIITDDGWIKRYYYKGHRPVIQKEWNIDNFLNLIRTWGKEDFKLEI